MDLGTAAAKDIQGELRKLKAIYDTYRKARLNVLYYGRLLSWTRRCNTLMEFLLAFGTSSLAVANWELWKSSPGSTAWKVIGGACVLIVILKPLLQFSHRIETFSKMVTGHADAFHDLRVIVESIALQGGVTQNDWLQYTRATERLKALCLDSDASPINFLRERCFQAVNLEIPPESLWYPNKKDKLKKRVQA